LRCFAPRILQLGRRTAEILCPSAAMVGVDDDAMAERYCRALNNAHIVQVSFTITMAVRNHTTIKTVRLPVTVGDRGKRRAARGWLSASQQQTLSGRAARVQTCTCVHDNIPCTRLPKWADRRIPTLPWGWPRVAMF